MVGRWMKRGASLLWATARTVALMLGWCVAAAAAPQGLVEAVRSPDARAESGADRGGELWRAGDREGAVAAWVDALERAQTGGAPPAERARIAYNLGVAAAERGEPMRSVAWFEAALRAAPRLDDAHFNVGLARADAGLGPRTGDGLAESLEAAARTVTPAESEWLAVLGAVLFAGAGLLEALRGGRLAGRLLLVVAAAQPLLLAPLALHLSERGAEPFMVIETGGVPLRAAPEDGAKRVGSLPAGTVVSYLDQLPGWTKIRFDGEARWVASDSLFALRL
ncbi:MAG: SH3 domain-containing protein [Planctomycetota bacterium]|nr:SH3 domain-containing protein [Planctomycetota bacterium]